MRADNVEVERFLEFLGAAGMVDVTVGQPYRLQRNAVFLDGLQDHIDIATGIDNHAFLRVGIEQNRAILLEMGNRDNARL